MKIKLLPLAVSAAIALPGVALADGPTVYGLLSVSGERVAVDDGAASSDRWDAISNESRLGFKGEEKINNQLKATYMAEWGVSADGSDAASDLAKMRNRSVGLAGDFGAVDVGQFDTPTKTSQGKVDQFNDRAGDLKYTLLGDERKANIIQYTSPSMNGLQAKVAVMPGESFDTGQSHPKDGIATAKSASVTFTQGNLYAAIAHDDKVSSTFIDGVTLSATPSANPLVSSAAVDFRTTRATGQYTLGVIQLGGMLQTATSDDGVNDIEQKGGLASAAYTMGQTVFKAQYAKSTTQVAGADSDARSIGLGVDQKLSAQTTVFAQAIMLSYKDEGAKEQTKNNLGVGISHWF